MREEHQRKTTTIVGNLMPFGNLRYLYNNIVDVIGSRRCSYFRLVTFKMLHSCVKRMF